MATEKQNDLVGKAAGFAGREAVGTAMVAGVSAVLFAAIAVFRKQPNVGRMAAGGAILGGIAGLGFGGQVFNDTFGRRSHVQAVQDQRAASANPAAAR